MSNELDVLRRRHREVFGEPSPATAAVTPSPPTSTPTALVEDSVLSCSLSDQILNHKEALDIVALRSLEFGSEDALVVEGRLSETTPSAIGAGYFDLMRGEAFPMELSFPPLLSSPCSESCSSQVFSQSPDGAWQLAQIWDEADVEGIWLVGQGEQVRLIDLVTTFPIWQWSGDSSLLWVDYSIFEYVGDYILPPALVQLDHPPLAISLLANVSGADPLDTEVFYVAFSPIDKTALSVLADEQYFDEEDFDWLYFFDFTLDMREPVSREKVPGIEKVEWSETLQDYLLILSNDDVLELRTLDGSLSVALPLSEFADLFPESVLASNIPFKRHALSPTGQHLALTLGDGRIFLFDCR